MPFKKWVTIFIFLFSTSLFANPNWNTFVAQLRVEAISKGIRPEVFDAAFKGIRSPHQRVLHLDRTQPEKRVTYIQYRNSRANASRIALGRQEAKRYAKLLNKIGAEYGVDPAFIVSLWGLETSYGRYMGDFPVIQSLATLSFDHRRSAEFRRELFYALEILNEGHVALKDFKGEWAGATGQPQFLPSSWHNYAVDYEGNGRKDIWKSHPDVFASIANYLVKHGWQSHQPWSVNVTLPADFDQNLLSLKIEKTVAEWEQMGVRLSGGKNINPQLQASIIAPDGGPTMMVFHNFKVIMQWNHSIYYAGTVGYLAEQVAGRSVE